MKVFAFDRDDAIDVNPHPRKSPMVPLEWVRYLAHETEHEVWATGNQALKGEADIPGKDEALEMLGEGASSIPPMRRERVLMLSKIFPDADDYIVVDDVDLSHLKGWDHYFPWDFVEVVQQREIEIGLSEDLLRLGQASD